MDQLMDMELDGGSSLVVSAVYAEALSARGKSV